MQLSSLPLLIAAIFGFLWFLVSRLHRRGSLSSVQRNHLALLMGTLLIWGLLIGYQSDMGRLDGESFLNLMPGYWLPYVPVVIAVTLMLLLTPLREGLRVLVDETPSHWLSGIHILRILALGTLIKASKGLFPQGFAWFVGGPDMLFGLSAIVLTYMAWAGHVNSRVLLFWHLVGALAIVLPIAGLMHIFMAEPLFKELFRFPMIMAPALVVPTLVMLNLLVAWRLFEKDIVKQ
ncbi:MAG: hypothetical protein B6D77_17240 [gamma proteobacterium symbiont of Ctena orbiculata]|nr:MAG: hypothetical protein B6D77_17240 [gamma proteobacterium symbiont of Ctena orbiculata]